MPKMHDNVLVYASDIEQETIDQAKVAAAMPWVRGHVALMPDAHVGKGSTVGSVIPTKGAIMPAAVGVDIGCGMIAVETSLTAEHLPDNLGPLHGMLRDAIPAGMGKSNDRGADPAAPKHWPIGSSASRWLDQKQHATAVNQFGTLGGGNHFVEVCLDESQHVWVVLHSGSRGVGNQLATQHIECAKGIMARYFIDLPDPDLAFLAEGTDEFDAYIGAMLWAQEYAMGNRETMMDAALRALAVAVHGPIDAADDIYVPEIQRINCHHNYTERENHMGQNVWLTRKGAIRAREGDLGIIPGSMGTSSFIVSGKGCIPAYHSCSHGAGRRMSRGQARRTLDVDAFRAQMAGRTWDDRDAVALLDEAPDSYKDIHGVIADSADLVTVEHELTAILNMKGVDQGPRRKGKR